MKSRIDLFFKLFVLCLLLGLGHTSRSQTTPNPNAAPNEFVQQVADQVLAALKADSSVRAGNTARVNQIVDELILPNVNFEKTTRLAAGRYWRQATPEQQAALVKAFRGTLGRSYSGAFTRVDEGTSIKVLPFRGEADATDLVVRSQVTQRANTQPIALDYRLEKTPQGWKIYDLNVENIWLIENYRNQFSQQISQNGIDGLIQALNQRAQQQSLSVPCRLAGLMVARAHRPTTRSSCLLFRFKISLKFSHLAPWVGVACFAHLQALAFRRSMMCP